MDPYFFHGFFCFPILGFLIVLFIGTRIGRCMTYRRLVRDGVIDPQQTHWHGRACCTSRRCNTSCGEPPAKPSDSVDKP